MNVYNSERDKYRREHLGIDGLSKADLKYAEKNFGITKDILDTLEEDEDKRSI